MPNLISPNYLRPILFCLQHILFLIGIVKSLIFTSVAFAKAGLVVGPIRLSVLTIGPLLGTLNFKNCSHNEDVHLLFYAHFTTILFSFCEVLNLDIFSVQNA